MKFVRRLAQWLLRPPKQRRSHRYVEPGVVAYYWNGSVPLPHQLRNISLTGAYLCTTERWRPGTVIQLTMRREQKDTVQSASAQFIIVACEVVRLDRDGVGLRFIAPDRDRRKALKHFMRDVIATAKRKRIKD